MTLLQIDCLPTAIYKPIEKSLTFKINFYKISNRSEKSQIWYGYYLYH